MRFVLSDLIPGTNYVIRARSKSGADFSEWSRNFTITTSSDNVAPKTPANPVASMNGTSFTLKWDAVTLSSDDTPASDLDHYDVEVSSTGSGNTGVYVVKDTKFEFSFEQNSNLFGTPQANVRMRVRAVDSAGNASAYTSLQSQTNPAPSAPTGFSGAAGNYSLNFTWNAVADLDLKQYRIYSGTDNTTQSTLVWTGTALNATIQINDTTTNRWYKVVAVDVFNTESASSNVYGPIKPTSPVSIDTTAPAVPTGLTATLANSTDESSATASVSWTAVSDSDLDSYVVGYRVKASPVNDWQYVTVDKTNTTTKIQGLLPYTDYDFRIRAKDFSANYSNWSTIYAATSQANTAPSTPAAPTCVSNTMRVQVTIPGTKAAGGAMEGDVAHYEVYASTTTGFTPAAANQLGRMLVGPAMVDTFQIPASGGAATQTWYVKIIAVDRGGLKSAASAQATAAPGLIDSANIVDLAVTNAKINDLAANKVTAGTGFVNDLTVKSKFTLGDATTVGAIESYGYTAGSAGFHFDKNLLEINQGVIRAPALAIQDSDNIVPPEYAAFEFTSSFYSKLTGQSNANWSIQTSGGKFGPQYARITSTAVASTFYYFGAGASDYNIFVEPGQTYIVSGYFRSNQASITNFNMRVRASDGSYLAYVTPAAGALSPTVWNRFSTTVTIPAGITTVQLMGRADWATIGDYVDFDGLQMERQMAGSTTPSPWTMPGVTSVDGAIIRTGQIVSNATVTVNGVQQPSWSINMAGGAQLGDALIRGTLLVGPTVQTEYATNGNMEVAGTSAFTVYGNSYITSPTLARTTTAGEVITGTGSLKITGTETSANSGALGFELTPATVIPDRNAINYSFSVKYTAPASATNAPNSYFSIQLIDSLGNMVRQKSVVFTDGTRFVASGGTKTATGSLSVPYGKNAAKIRVVALPNAYPVGLNTVIFDNISVTSASDLGASYISSSNYVANAAGWKLNSSGIGEFNDMIIRGVVSTAQAGKRIVMGDYDDTGFIGLYSGNPYEWIGGNISFSDDASIELRAGYIGDTIPATPTGSESGGSGGMGESYTSGILTLGRNTYLVPNGGGVAELYGQTYTTITGQSGVNLNMGAGKFYISDILVPHDNVDTLGTLLQGTYSGPMNIKQDAYQLNITATNAPMNISVDNRVMTLKFTETSTSAVVNKLTLDTTGITLNAEGIKFQNDWVPNDALKNFTGNVSDQMMWMMRALGQPGCTGGGVVDVDSTYRISWTARFIPISLGRGSTMATAGFFDIIMPPAGTVIPGYGGASSVTVTSAGILLNAWEALYYEIPFGSGSASQDTNFRVVSYSSTFTVPNNWLLIAVRNATAPHMVYFANGVSMSPWFSCAAKAGYALYSPGVENAEVRRVGNEVFIRGAFANTGLTVNATHTVGNLPSIPNFNPPKNYVNACGVSSQASAAVAFITSSGDIQIRTGASVSSGYYFMTFSWMLA